MDVVKIGRNDEVQISVSDMALALGCFRDIHFSPLRFFLYNTTSFHRTFIGLGFGVLDIPNSILKYY